MAFTKTSSTVSHWFIWVQSALVHTLSGLNYVLDFLLWIFWGEASFLQPGQSPELPMEVVAVPGLTSLLDIALFRSVETELTGTLYASHALLQAWLDVQAQARRVLRFVKQRQVPAGAFVDNEGYNRRLQLESFSRACYEGACHVLERMSTDRLAQTANLTDPFDSCGSSGSTSGHLIGSDGRAISGGSDDGAHSTHQQQEFLLQEASWDTGRRRLPLQQRPRDCWETARLLCPDYVWGDDVVTQCQKTLRQLLKHPFCLMTFSEWHSFSSPLMDAVHSSAVHVDHHRHHHHHRHYNQQEHLTTSYASAVASSILTNTLEREEATLLMQLALVDVPTRMNLFKAALEAESVVSKRLYLVKTEYRAPLRAFWEAHSSVQRAPSLDLVEQSLEKLAASGSSVNNAAVPTASSSSSSSFSSSSSSGAITTSKDKRKGGEDEPKEKLQKLMESDGLVKLLAVERQMEQYELDMAVALYPFCELARYLDQKKATPKNDDFALRESLARLKTILLASTRQRSSNSSSEYSAGIRPLLLDLQGIPRDDEVDCHNCRRRGRGRRCHNGNVADLDCLKSETTIDAIDARLDEFIGHLKLLARMVSSDKHKKHSFYCDKKTELDPPTATDCRKFDGALFKCHFKDWYNMAVQQHELTTETYIDPETGIEVVKINALAEEIRRAEMAVSLSMVSTEPALRKVLERVQVITRDRAKRFDILQESLHDLCLREMNLHIQLTAPPINQVLELKSTDGAQVPAMAGVFGIPLLRAGHVLPLG